MVQYDVGVYLNKETEKRVVHGHVNAAIVYIETRDHYFVPQVLLNAMHFHPGWNVYVFGTAEVLERIGSVVSGFTGVLIRGGLRPTSLSAMLLEPAFWRIFEETHVLFVQKDCVLVRGVQPEHMAFDMIGAVCGRATSGDFIINGGLSLRRVDAMKRALAGMTSEDKTHPEDVAFTRAMRRNPAQFKLPTMMECDAFAIESRGNPFTAIGAHGTDKDYAPAKLLRDLISSIR